ncbi:MAG: hypothetical protein GY841_20605 [FCB group bacterium]|nr:hypothetical protein [FCB group bacterium]
MAIPIEKTKVGVLVPPQLKDNGEPSGLTYIDTKGYKHLRVYIVTGTTDIATTAAPKLQECDTSGGSYADITSAALADAIADDEDDKAFVIDVDLTKNRKRYIKCLITAGNGSTGTNLALLGILSRPDSGTIDVDAGATELISV